MYSSIAVVSPRRKPRRQQREPNYTKTETATKINTEKTGSPPIKPGRTLSPSVRIRSKGKKKREGKTQNTTASHSKQPQRLVGRVATTGSTYCLIVDLVPCYLVGCLFPAIINRGFHTRVVAPPPYHSLGPRPQRMLGAVYSDPPHPCAT